MATVETQSISFVQSFLAALPFTQHGKDVKKKLDEVKQVNQATFFEKEKERVDEIQFLCQNGREKEALRQLIDDTNVENPLQYYNQLISRERREGRDKNPKVYDTTDDANQTLDQNKRMDERESFCQWKGYNRKYNVLVCTNQILYHPWKTVTNVCGQKERMKMKHCAYHQKYCLDEGKRHMDKLIKITTPNAKGLCTECHILVSGAPPMDLARYPGIRRKEKLGEEEKIDDSTTLSPSEFPGGERMPVKIKRHEEPRLHRTISTVDAALKILRRWRKRKAFKAKIEIQELHRHRNRAAVKIQARFRYSQLRARLWRGKTMDTTPKAKVEETISTEIANTSYLVTGSRTHKKSPSSSLLAQYESHIFCQPCSSVDLTEVQKTQGTQFRQQPKTRRKKKPCELPMCLICYKDRRVPGKGRQRISSAPYTGAKLSLSDIEAMDQSFFDLDHFDLGSLPRNDFFQIVRSFYNKLGQTLLPEEVLSVANAFECRDGRDGHIDYIKYVTFAKKQNHPCRVHSRLICTICTSRSRCKTNTVCTKFEEDPLMPAFCKCGKYKSRHDQVPVNTLGAQTFRRGFHIFTSEDLKRTFDRRIKADTGTQLTSEMQSLEDAMARPGVHGAPISSPSIGHDISIIMKKKRPALNKTKEKKRYVYSPLLSRSATSSAMQHILVSTPYKHNGISSFNEKKSPSTRTTTIEKKRKIHSPLVSNPSPASPSIVPSLFTEGPMFSAPRLESMMDACVEYRKRPVTPKPSIPCPLCRLSFYEDEKLQKHLKSRHSIQEIQHRIQDFTGAESSSYPQVKVEWKGKSTIVPPLPPPVPLNICNHHVPPHPKCKTCKVTLEKSELFPPIRFYTGAFVEVRNQEEIHGMRMEENHPQASSQENANDDEGPTITIKNFHFSLNDADLGVVTTKITNHRAEQDVSVGKLVAICEDGRQKRFLGLQFYRQVLQAVGTSKNGDELVLEPDVHWVEMKYVIGRQHVFHCTQSEFEEKKKNMNAHQNEIRFCQYKMRGEDLVPI